jgi:hypothetical protein
MVCFVLIFSAHGLSQIINIEDKRSEFTDSVQWHERLDLGFNLVKNTKVISTITAAAQLEFVFNKKLLLSLTRVNFVKAGDENFVNEAFQHIRYNSRLTRGLVYELFAQIQYNELANVKLRALAGTGLRFKLIKKEKQKAYWGVSYMYEYDEESEEDIVHQDSRLSTYLSFSLNPSPIVRIASTSYYQPLFAEFNDFRLSSETSAIFEFNRRLSFRTTYRVTYDSRAARGAPTTTYALINGLSYNF